MMALLLPLQLWSLLSSFVPELSVWLGNNGVKVWPCPFTASRQSLFFGVAFSKGALAGGEWSPGWGAHLASATVGRMLWAARRWVCCRCRKSPPIVSAVVVGVAPWGMGPSSLLGHGRGALNGLDLFLGWPAL